MPVLFYYLSLAISILACVIAGYVAVRAGRWRESDSAKDIVRRIDKAEADIKLHDQTLKSLADDVAGLPTKADFARLEGEIKSTCRVADRTEQAVIRVEDYLRNAPR